MDDDELPAAHPAFVAHFSDPIYDPNGPDIDETAPFGTDEGSDELHDWAGRIDELLQDPTVRYMLGEAADTVASEVRSTAQPDVDDALIGVGFTLLRLSGQIDDEGRGWVREALERQMQRSGQPEYTTMLGDLASFERPAARRRPNQSPSTEQGPKPWLYLRLGGGDAQLTRWCRQREQALASDSAWVAWWVGFGFDRLEFSPDLFSRRDYFELRADGRRLFVWGGGRRLGRIMRSHGRVVTAHTPPLASAMTLQDVPELLDSLVLAALQTSAERLHLATPPTRLP